MNITTLNDGATMRLDIAEDFEGGLALCASALRVALNRAIQRGEMTAEWATAFFEEVGSIADESIENADFVVIEDTDIEA